MLCKTYTAALLFCAAVLPLFAAGTKDRNKTSPENRIILRLADNQPDGYPTVTGDLAFARLVAERSGGRITIEVYNNGLLGDEKSVIEQVQFGGIDFCRVSISPLASFYPDLNVLQLPYLYRSSLHLWNVLNGEIGSFFLDAVNSSGFQGLCYFDSGARSFYTVGKPIRSVKDMKNLRIRVQESSLMMALVSALGAVPVPMRYEYVYEALRMRDIDGAENNFPSYDSSGHYEVARFFSVDEHTRVPEMLIASNMSLDKLSAPDRALILQAAKDASVIQIQAWADYEQSSRLRMQEAGCVILPIENVQEFAEAISPVYGALSETQRRLVAKIRAVED
ncbi:TRAP transporter substrate-binding protein [Treponema brennaborense]|uniref:TRAP dicarboxylate transporter, DctP subunit n=1 Tax=Treponema brennaborense (strain DSM 12168 / CIP 105900 / DD5/3) TaxID=906968 RepID=F4LIB8_TREBD|nr:TRAP transporter substrate-binding protein [Treponema brennaborense]AEE16159.1 TRAP dicarboxylate transporter, DctP subunit [Treponema brennaborense DSM 12168]